MHTKVLRASADSLDFEQDERGPDQAFRLRFEALANVDRDEQKGAQTLLDALTLKQRARRWAVRPSPQRRMPGHQGRASGDDETPGVRGYSSSEGASAASRSSRSGHFCSSCSRCTFSSVNSHA